MNLYAWSSSECDYEVDISHAGQYTTKATIMIHNVAAHCMEITCATTLFQESRVLGKEIIMLFRVDEILNCPQNY